jgi:hypothetical protein
MTHLCSGEHLSAVLYLLADLPHNIVLEGVQTDGNDVQLKLRGIELKKE